MAFEFGNDKNDFSERDKGWGRDSWPESDRRQRRDSGSSGFGDGERHRSSFRVPAISVRGIKLILLLVVIVTALMLMYVYRLEISYFLQLLVKWVITLIIDLIVLRFLFWAIFSRRR